MCHPIAVQLFTITLIITLGWAYYEICRVLNSYLLKGIRWQSLINPIPLPQC